MVLHFFLCCLHAEGDKVLVFDVNSTNGTFINGVDCTPMSYIEVGALAL